MAGPELAQYWTESKQDGRRYKHPHTGEFVPSVTTITGMEDKPNLIQWAADMTLRWAVENWNSLGQRSDQQAYNWGRYRWRDVRDERALIGTGAHAYVEAELTDSWDYPDLSDLPESLQCVDQWHNLREHHDIKPLFVEVTAWNHTDKWAGTLDLGCELDGVLTLGDVKTSKGLWEGHRMQLATLARAEVYMMKQPDGTWIEIEAPKWDQYAFFHLRPDYYDPMKEQTIPAYWDIQYLDPDEIDTLYDQFLGYRRAWGAQQDLKELRKQKELAEKKSIAELAKLAEW